MGRLLSLKAKSEQRLALIINAWRRVVMLPFCLANNDDLTVSSLLIKNVVSSRKVIIAGNGPTFSRLLSSIPNLSNADIITSNHAYMSPGFGSIAPKLHFIIDPKIVSGIWSLDMIDQIHAASPSTVVVLDVRWKALAKMKKYRRHPHIAWILPIYLPSYYSNVSALDFSSGFHGLNVTACAFSVALTLGYQSLAFIGVEGDGLFREIIDHPSHFYPESSKDSSMNSYDSMIDSLSLATYSLLAWRGFVKTAHSHGFAISNLSDQGIFDVCNRQDMDSFLLN